MKISSFKISTVLSLLFVPFLLLSAQAQWPTNQYPNAGVSRFSWQGVVDGTSTIRIQGRQVNVQTQSGLPVQRQQYNFSDPLPRTASHWRGVRTSTPISHVVPRLRPLLLVWDSVHVTDNLHR